MTSSRAAGSSRAGSTSAMRDSTTNARATAIVTAAAALYRREALEAVGGFDEDYFLYCEDGDVCLRMLLAGYRGLYVPEPKAFHVRGRDGRRRGLRCAALLPGPERADHPAQGLPASVLLRLLAEDRPVLCGQIDRPRGREGYREPCCARTARSSALDRRTVRKRRAVQGADDPSRCLLALVGRTTRRPSGTFSDEYRSRPDPLPAPGVTARVFERIRDARPPKLFVIADGPRPGNAEDARDVRGARAAVDAGRLALRGGAQLRRREPRLKRRIPSGLDWVFERVEQAIILEDDCLPAPLASFPTARSCSSATGTTSGSSTYPEASCCPQPPTEGSYHFSRGAGDLGLGDLARAWRLFDVDLTDWHAMTRRQRKARLRRDVRGAGRAAALGLRLGQLATRSTTGTPSGATRR